MIANATKAHEGLLFRRATVIVSLMAKLNRLFTSPLSMWTKALTGLQHACLSKARLDFRAIRLQDGLNHPFTKKIFVLLRICNRLT